MGDKNGGEILGTAPNNQESIARQGNQTSHSNHGYHGFPSNLETAPGPLSGRLQGYQPRESDVGHFSGQQETYGTQDYSSTFAALQPNTLGYHDTTHTNINYEVVADDYNARHLGEQSHSQSIPLASTSVVSPQPRPIERSNSLLAPDLDASAVFSKSPLSISTGPLQQTWEGMNELQSTSKSSSLLGATQDRFVLPASAAPVEGTSLESFSLPNTPYQHDSARLPEHFRRFSDQHPSSADNFLNPTGQVIPYPHSHSQSHSTASVSDQSPLHSPFASHFPQGFGNSFGSFGVPPAYSHSYSHNAQDRASAYPSAQQSQGIYSQYGQHTSSWGTQSANLYGNGSTAAQHQAYRPHPSTFHRPSFSLPAAGPSDAFANTETSRRDSFTPTYLPTGHFAGSNAQPGPAAIQTDVTASYHQPPSYPGNSASASWQSDASRLQNTSHTPAYRLRQYQSQPLSLSAGHDTTAFPRPSPTWSASPIVSPALMAYPPGIHSSLNLPTDYFASQDPLPSPIDQFRDQQMLQEQLQSSSNPSSPPNSRSPNSQESAQIIHDIPNHGSSSGEYYSNLQEGDLPDRQGNGAFRGSARAKGRNSRKAAKASVSSQPYVKKETRIVAGTCDTCGKVFATINIRGHPEDFANDFDLIYYCLECAPESLGTTRSALEASLGLTQNFREGGGINTQPVQLPPGKTIFEATPASSETVKLVPRGSKKRIRATDVSSPTICDVCSRWVAHGAPVAHEPGAELAFNVEIVCALCCEKYRRCSDCGGGGGARLGVGKWRCKELFSPGRKTCDLSHARQSSIATMEYLTTRISDIPDEEMPELLTRCEAVFRTALLSGLAVPEVLERGAAMVSTYDDVMAKIIDGWEEAKKVIKEDVEAADNYRRYIGLRWSATKPRKVMPRKKGKDVDLDASVDTSEMPTEESTKHPTSSKVMRPEMHLSGYVSGEWDIYGGTFYITVSVPYSTGEQYEGSAHIIGLLQQRVVKERQDMVDDLIQQGRHAEAMSVPPILHAFTMLFYSPDSKLMAYMESKRSMLPLQRYIDKYPGTNPRLFPPYRKAYIAPTQKPEEWTVLVRRIQPAIPKQAAVPSVTRLLPTPEAGSRAVHSIHQEENPHNSGHNYQS